MQDLNLILLFFCIDNLPPANIATSITPQDQISAGVALYARVNTSGATYGSVPQRLSSIRSLPFILDTPKNTKKIIIHIDRTGELGVGVCLPNT